MSYTWKDRLGHHYVYAADVKDIEDEGKCLPLSVKKPPIVFFSHNSKDLCRRQQMSSHGISS